MIDLITAFGTALSGAASLVKLANGLKNAELQKLTSDLNIQLANIQNDVAALLNENRGLKEKMDKIKNEKLNPLTFNKDDGFYYDNESNIPYCPNCYESEKAERRHLKVKTITCPNCHEYFGSKLPVAGIAHPSKNSRF